MSPSATSASSRAVILRFCSQVSITSSSTG
jgi:hypothetical protein